MSGRATRAVIWLGAVAAFLLAAVLIQRRAFPSPDRPLEISEAFRHAWRDSFGTDVADDLAKVLQIDHLYEDFVYRLEWDGFNCTLSQLNSASHHFICTRHAWSFHALLPQRERWTLEVLCASRSAGCRVKQLYASISNV